MARSFYMASAGLALAATSAVLAGGPVTTWSVTQITNDGASNSFPSIAGGRIAWVRGSGTNAEIMLYENGSITQLTDDSVKDALPQCASGIVAWTRPDADTEVVIFDGTDVIQLTDDTNFDLEPRVWGDTVVWNRWNGSNTDVMTWDGTSIVPLVGGSCNDTYPRTHSGNLLWRRYGTADTPSSCGCFCGDLFYRDGVTGVTTQITDDNFSQTHYAMAGSTVAWRSNDSVIRRWDADTGVTTPISVGTAAYDAPSVAPGGRVAWLESTSIMLNEGGATTSVADGVVLGPCLSETLVVWLDEVGADYGIFADDGSGAMLVDTVPFPVQPVVDGDSIVWTTTEVFLAQRFAYQPDIDDSGVVDVTDLVTLILAWGPCPAEPDPCPADLDDDGEVGVNDLVLLILAWG